MGNLLELYILQGRFEDAVDLCEQEKERWGKDNMYINRYLATLLLIQENVEGVRKLAASSQADLGGSIYAKLHLWDKAEQKI